MKKLTDRKIRYIVKKLYKACKANDDICRVCANAAFGNCPNDKAWEIESWWYDRKNREQRSHKCV